MTFRKSQSAKTPCYSVIRTLPAARGQDTSRPLSAAVEGGYGADYNTTVEVGAGEQLVDRAVIKLFEMRGLLRDAPDLRF